jgi:hypothetical protein
MAGATEITTAGGEPAAGTGNAVGDLFEYLFTGQLAADPRLGQLQQQRDQLGGLPKLNQKLVLGQLSEIDKQIAAIQGEQAAFQRNIDASPITQNLLKLISGPDISGAEQSLNQLIEQQNTEGIADLRERFTASGAGSGIGTPAAVAESRFRADAAPRAQIAKTQLQFNQQQQQLAAIMPLLQLAASFGSRGFPGAENVVTQQPGFLDILAGIAGPLAGLATGGGALIPAIAGLGGGGGRSPQTIKLGDPDLV